MKNKIYDKKNYFHKNLNSWRIIQALFEEFKSPLDINVHMYTSCENISCLISCENKCTKLVNLTSLPGVLSAQSTIFK